MSASATSWRTSRPQSTSTPTTSASNSIRMPHRRSPTSSAGDFGCCSPGPPAPVHAPLPPTPRPLGATASTWWSTTWTPPSRDSATQACCSAATSSPAPAGARSCSPTRTATSSNSSRPRQRARLPPEGDRLDRRGPGQVEEGREGVGIAQRIPADGGVRRDPGENLLDRSLELLAAEGAGDGVDDEDPVRHVPGGQLGTQGPPQPGLDVGQNRTGREHEEAQQLALVVGS